MSAITTHVLDTSVGHPAAGVAVHLEYARGATWEIVGGGETDRDGRVRTLVPEGTALAAGLYRLTYDVAAYFERSATRAFYPSITISFRVDEASSHYHVPLLLSPFGYSTYRGS
jgi:5-hydroxyisourate hydrolase